MGLSKGIGNVSIVGFFIVSLLQFNFEEVKINIKKYKNVWLISLVFFLFLIGMIYTENQPLGWKLVRRNHRFLLIPLLFLMNVDLIKKQFKNVLFAYFIGISTIGLLTIILYYSPEEFVIWLSELTPFMQKYITHYDRVSFGFYSPFYDRLQFSNMLGIATLVGVYFYRIDFQKKITLALIPILAYASILLGGRSGQLALLTTLFVLLVLYIFSKFKTSKNKSRFGLISIIAILAFISIPFLAYKFNHSVNKRYGQMRWELKTYYSGNPKAYDITHFTTVRRLVSWENTWNLAKNNLWLGVGTGDYDSELQKIYNNDNFNLPTNSHSQWLYYWATFGIIGLLIFLLVIYNWWKAINKNSIDYTLALSFLLFYSLVFMFGVPLTKHIDNMTFISLFCALGIVFKKEQLT